MWVHDMVYQLHGKLLTSIHNRVVRDALADGKPIAVPEEHQKDVNDALVKEQTHIEKHGASAMGVRVRAKGPSGVTRDGPNAYRVVFYNPNTKQTEHAMSGLTKEGAEWVSDALSLYQGKTDPDLYHPGKPVPPEHIEARSKALKKIKERGVQDCYKKYTPQYGPFHSATSSGGVQVKVEVIDLTNEGEASVYWGDK